MKRPRAMLRQHGGDLTQPRLIDRHLPTDLDLKIPQPIGLNILVESKRQPIADDGVVPAITRDGFMQNSMMKWDG